jgi:hypothetical protein
MENFMYKKNLTILLGMALLIPAFSYAEGSYVKLGVGQSRYYEGDSARATGYYLAYGSKIDSSLDMEVGFVDFGRVKLPFVYEDLSPDDYTVRYKTQSIYLAGIGNIPVSTDVTLQGKLGLAYHRSSAIRFPKTTVDQSQGELPTDGESKVRALLGAGLTMKFSKEISGAVEYTYFGRDGYGAKLSMFNAALLYHF